MKLEIDGVYFKNKVLDLRKRLNQMKKSGSIDENFEKDLEELLELEKILLKNLIPYYRLSGGMKRTKIRVDSLEKLGNSKFDGFIESMFRLNESRFIVSSTDKEVKYLYYDGWTIEWSQPIKEIRESIVYMEKISDNELILFALDKIYILSFHNLYGTEDIDLDYKIEAIKFGKGIEFSRVIMLADKVFLAYDGESFFLIKLEKNNYKYGIKILKDEEISSEDLVDLQKIEINKCLLIFEDGYVLTISYKEEQLVLGEKLKLIDSQIRKIAGLENEGGEVSNYAVLGNNGELAIVSSSDLGLIRKIDNLSGNLFDIKSKNGLGIILSEDGILYLLEENFENWSLNESTRIDNGDFINILGYGDLEYILMDIQGNLSSLKIERVMTEDDLWNLAIYN